MGGLLLLSQRRLRTSSKGDIYLSIASTADQFPALQEYEALSKEETCHPDVWSNLACCYFMLGMYPEAETTIQKGLFSAYYYTTMII